jgi:hypothetical protein
MAIIFLLMGLLKKAASGVPCFRRSGFAQAGRHCSVLTYSTYAPRVKMAAALPRGGVLHAGLGGLPMLDFFEPTRSL